MSSNWENHEPAPIEFMHSRLLAIFHEWRRTKTDFTSVEITGTVLNDLIAQAKRETYIKYPNQDLQRAIPKSEM